MYDFAAVREAVVNAIVHNDWSNEYAPKFEMFSDRLVISSNCDIQPSTTKEEFLEGYSLPKNKELMKVFNDLDLVEQMGTGIIRILPSYDKESFEFFHVIIRVTFPFNKDKFREENEKILGINIRIVQRNIKTLIEIGLIERTGLLKR